MMISGRHNWRCETAKLHICQCAACGGALHGWVGSVAMASPEQAEQRLKRRDQVKARWAKWFRPHSKRSNKHAREASTDSAQLDIVDWLAQRWPSMSKRTQAKAAAGDSAPRDSASANTNPRDKVPGDAECGAGKTTQPGKSSTNYVDELGRRVPEDPGHAEIVETVAHLGSTITRSALGQIDSFFPDADGRKAARKQLAQSHFWCDLFAALATGLDRCKEGLDHLPELVTDLILGSSKSSMRTTTLPRVMVTAAVEQAWKPVRELLESSLHLEKAIQALRVLAVLACPALEDHSEVFERCLVPLGDEALQKATKEWLRSALPAEITAKATG